TARRVEPGADQDERDAEPEQRERAKSRISSLVGRRAADRARYQGPEPEPAGRRRRHLCLPLLSPVTPQRPAQAEDEAADEHGGAGDVEADGECALEIRVGQGSERKRGHAGQREDGDEDDDEAPQPAAKHCGGRYSALLAAALAAAAAAGLRRISSSSI